MAAKRLTRKEIVREDPIKKTLKETSYWVLENRNILIGIGIAIVVAIVGVLAWHSYSSARNEQMQSEFAAALETFHASVKPEDAPETPEEGVPAAEESSDNETSDATGPAEDQSTEEGQTEATAPEPEYRFETEEQRYQAALAEFKSIAENYSGNHVGQLARYYTGLSLIELGKESEAREELETVAEEADRPDTRNLARNALAQLSAQQENHEDAAGYLQQILDNPSPNFPQQVALMRLAKYQESSGDLEKALETYRDIESRFAGSTFANQAQAEIGRLELLVEEPVSPAPVETPGESEEPTNQES